MELEAQDSQDNLGTKYRQSVFISTVLIICVIGKMVKTILFFTVVEIWHNLFFNDYYFDSKMK
jgi:hypothetical protein